MLYSMRPAVIASGLPVDRAIPAASAREGPRSRHPVWHARFLRKLRETPEGEGNLLDNSMIVYGSGLGDGNRHSHHDLPILFAGRGGGTIETGRHVHFQHETPLNNLFLSMLDRMGSEQPRFGDSTGRLKQLG